MVIDAKYPIGEKVFIESDCSQEPYYVTGYIVRQKEIVYLLNQSGYEIEMYEFQLKNCKKII